MDHISTYRERLGRLPGCSVQVFPDDRTSSGNYFVLFVGAGAARSRDELYAALKAVGIQCKRYFYPPVHEQALFQRYPKRLSAKLTTTIQASREGLALPLYSHMERHELERVCVTVERLLAH